VANVIEIIPLGGIGEFGMNCTLLRFEDEMLILDAGMGFPEESVYGVDVCIPDFEILEQYKQDITAIILTHGHFDHTGSVNQLLRVWDVPVYAHRLELPYLTGRSDYPPPDPTVGGGLMSALSRFFPRKGRNLGAAVHALPADGTVPGLPQWRWVHTPGHSPGHISLLRDNDRTLIAGDAFVTAKQESLGAVMMQIQGVSGPPAFFTPSTRLLVGSCACLLFANC